MYAVINHSWIHMTDVNYLLEAKATRKEFIYIILIMIFIECLTSIILTDLNIYHIGFLGFL